MIWAAKTNKRHFGRGWIHVLPILITLFIIRTVIFHMFSLFQKTMLPCFQLLGFLPSLEIRGWWKLSPSPPVYIITGPWHNPDNRIRELQLPLLSVRHITHKPKVRPHLDFEEHGQGRECERGLFCILPCGLLRGKHEWREISHYSFSQHRRQSLPSTLSSPELHWFIFSFKQVTWSTLFGPQTYWFCFHTSML